MFAAIKKIFSLSETQIKTITLLEIALKNKQYKIGRNEFFYDEGRNHSLCVQIELTPELTIELDTLFAIHDFIAFNPQELNPKGLWASELSSRRAYNIVLNHFEILLLKEEAAEKLAANQRRKNFTEIVRKSI